MTEIINTLLHPLPNAIMTVMMGIIALYWLFTLVGGIGFEDIDFHFDMDADADVDVDGGDLDTHEPGIFMKFLNFLNVGKVPFMLVLSTFKFLTWVVTLVTTSLVNVTIWGWQSVFILIPVGTVCLFLTKFATNPMAKFFKEIGYKEEEAIDFLGRSGKMLSTISDKKIGVAEFMVEKNPMKLNVISHTGEQINYGDYVVVQDESEDGKTYYVSKELSIRNI